MGITAITGPQVVFGIANSGSTSVPAEYNEERGPSLFDLGSALADPRPGFNYGPGNAVGTQLIGLWDQVGLVDATVQIQSSAANNMLGTIISCLIGSSVSTVLTLNTTVTSSVNGVATNVSVYAPETGKQVVMPLACDFTSATVTFGSAATVQMWNPTNGSARCVAVQGTTNSSQDDSGVTVSVAGRDVYGFKLTESIVMSSLSRTALATGRKAFKYISAISLVNSSLLNSTNINIGFAEKFGMPTVINTPAYMQNLIITTSGSSVTTVFTGATSTNSFVLAAPSTLTQTATTADVRGTWASSTLLITLASSAPRMQIYTVLGPNSLATVTSTNFSGIFGNPQFSSV